MTVSEVDGARRRGCLPPILALAAFFEVLAVLGVAVLDPAYEGDGSKEVKAEEVNCHRQPSVSNQPLSPSLTQNNLQQQLQTPILNPPQLLAIPFRQVQKLRVSPHRHRARELREVLRRRGRSMGEGRSRVAGVGADDEHGGCNRRDAFQGAGFGEAWALGVTTTEVVGAGAGECS